MRDRPPRRITMPDVLHRKDVPAEQRWDDVDLYPSPEAWDAAYAATAARLDDVRVFRGTLAGGPKILATWLDTYEALERELGRLRVYAGMSSSVDAGDEEARARADKVGALMADAAEAASFAMPELAALPEGTLRAWISNEPALADRERWLQRFERDARFLRHPEVEALLGALGTPFSGASSTHGLLANAELTYAPAVDADGREHAITQAVISTLKGSSDRALRESAWTSYADAHLGLERTMANLLVTGARQTNLVARTRGYDDALHMTLVPLEVPRSVVESLLDAYQAHLPVWHRWFEAKKRYLGLDALRPWDVDAPVAPNPPTVPYDQAVAWIGDALAPLGSEYVEAMTHGALHGRWVDRAPNAGKRMGAFSSGWGGSKPYIMMSYTDDLGSMSTLAHELGHSLHSYLSTRAQPYPYARYTLFAAEVASNFNQAMTRDHLFRERAGDRNFELALIDETMANFGRYFLIMPTLMRFELALHDRAARGEGLSAGALGDLLADLYQEAYGPAMEIDRRRVGITWAQFHTHLYARFYVFMYATGIAGAHAFARRILDGVPGAVDGYLGFLREGGRTPPIEAMQRAGVDLSSAAPVEEAFRVLSQHVDRFEALIE
jgi:oligoendopeptidase F